MNDIERANKAKAVLESPAYQEAYDLVRQAIIERIEKCPLSETPTAEDLRRCLKLLRDVRANMTTAINTGKLVSFRLEQDEVRRKNPLRHLFR